MKAILILLIGIFLFSNNLFSQEKKIDLSAKKLVILTDKTKTKKVKFLKDNKKIVYKILGDDKKKRGKLHIINDSLIAIDTNKVLLSSLTMIGGRSVGLKTAKIVGGTVMAAGVAMSTIGVIIYIQSQSKGNTGCETAIGEIIGAFMFAGGTVIILIGGIPLAIKPKHFDLVNKWDIKVGYEEK